MKKLMLCLSVCFASVNAYGISYFESKINYWNDQETRQAPEPAKNPEPVKPQEERKEAQKEPASQFNWKHHLDTEQDDFFKEGSNIPPAPFMEVARRPTDENIQNWLKYIEKKNQITNRLNQRLQEFSGSKTASTIPLPSRSAVDVKRYVMTFYFDSRCPHCHRMFDTVLDLQSKGVYVDAVQVDRGPVRGLNMSYSQLAAGDPIRQKLSGVPHLSIHDLKENRTIEVPGYQSTQSVLARIGGGN